MSPATWNDSAGCVSLRRKHLKARPGYAVTGGSDGIRKMPPATVKSAKKSISLIVIDMDDYPGLDIYLR